MRAHPACPDPDRDRVVTVELRTLTAADAEAHCAGEDELTVRWLTGSHGTVDGTREHFQRLAANAAAGAGKRAWAVWVDGRLGGYVDIDPDLDDGLLPQDVSISYAVHPWARGRGVAGEAVELACDVLRREEIGTRAAIRVDPDNAASLRVATKAGFRFERQFVSATDTHPDGTPATLDLYVLDLNASGR